MDERGSPFLAGLLLFFFFWEGGGGGGFISSLDVRARLFNAGLRQPRRSVKSDFRSESFKRKFNTIHLLRL